MTENNRNKRFWRDAEAVSEGDGFVVLLDGKPVRLPSGAVLRLGTRPLAQAVAAEWNAAGGGEAGGGYGPQDLGLTRLAGTALERVAPRRAEAIGQLLRFVDADALCYRAAHPESLVRQQRRDWDPWLRWCAQRFGATLRVTEGVMPATQDAATRAVIADALRQQSDAALAALGVLAPSLGSLVLGLAVLDGALSAERAHHLSVLDDRFEEERWGGDAEAAARRGTMLRDCGEAERFARLAAPDATGDAAEDVGATHLLLRGRVQGVGYRAWLRAESLRLGLRGWVRNLADGRVEAVLVGPEAVRARMVRLARQGPTLARVAEVLDAPWRGDAVPADRPGFEIRPTSNETAG